LGHLAGIQWTFRGHLLCQYEGNTCILRVFCGVWKISFVPVIAMGGRYNITNVYIIKQYTYAYDIFTSFQPWIAKNIRQRHEHGSQFYQSSGGGGGGEKEREREREREILNLQLDSLQPYELRSNQVGC
jgi:hypothetical protein